MEHKPVKPEGPYHDFWSFKEGSPDYSDYDELLGRKDAPVRIPDDILRYFHDLFIWVPSINPCSSNREKRCTGFNYFGPTVINKEGGIIFERILFHLMELYNLAPEPIILTGFWTVEDYEMSSNSGYYEKHEVEKSWLLHVLATLHKFAHQAAIGSHYVLHIGV